MARLHRLQPHSSPSCAPHLRVGSGAWPGPVGGGPARPITHPCSLTCHCFLLPPGSVPQPPGKALTGRSVGPSSALPGDPYNSAVGPANFEISPSASSDSGEGSSVRPSPPSSVPLQHGSAYGPLSGPHPGRKRGRLYMGPTCTWLTSSRVVQQLERAWSGPSQAVGQDTPYPVLFWAEQDRAGLCLESLSGRVWELRGGPAPLV